MGIFDNATSVVINNKEVQSIIGPNNTIYYQKMNNGEHWYFDYFNNGALRFENLIFDKVYFVAETYGSSSPDEYAFQECFGGVTSGYCATPFESGAEVIIYRTIESYNTQDSDEMVSIANSLLEDLSAFGSAEEFIDMYLEEVCRLEI